METREMKVVVALRHSLPIGSWKDKLEVGVVQWWTKSKYFHVELILDGKWISAHLSDGVQVNDVRELNIEDWVYVDIGPVVVTTDQYEKVWKYIGEQVGTGYDWKGIFLSQGVKIGWQNEEQWFCSEIVAKVCQMLMVEEFMDVVPNKVSPKMIADMYGV